MMATSGDGPAGLRRPALERPEYNSYHVCYGCLPMVTLGNLISTTLCRL